MGDRCYVTRTLPLRVHEDGPPSGGRAPPQPWSGQHYQHHPHPVGLPDPDRMGQLQVTGYGKGPSLTRSTQVSDGQGPGAAHQLSAQTLPHYMARGKVSSGSLHQPPPAMYNQSKVANIHMINGNNTARPYINSQRSYRDPMTTNGTGPFLNGNRTPSPPPPPPTSGLCQEGYLKGYDSFYKPGPGFPAKETLLRRTTGSSPAGQSSRRQAIYIPSSGNPSQPYFIQPQGQGEKDAFKYSHASQEPSGAHCQTIPLSKEMILNFDNPRGSPNRCMPARPISKPPRPPSQIYPSSSPRAPPRSRPKSWTSSLFNVMHGNQPIHPSCQCLPEEKPDSNIVRPEKKSKAKKACDMAMPVTAASAGDGQKFYSLPRNQPASNDSAGNLLKQAFDRARTRTPSPFRSMIKGLVKGELF